MGGQFANEMVNLTNGDYDGKRFLGKIVKKI